MLKPKVFVTRRIFPEALDMIASKTRMDLWKDELPPPKEILLEKMKDCHGILSLLTDELDTEFFKTAEHLRVVSQIAVGYDNIDIVEATRRLIPVGHTPHVLNAATADMAFLLMMAAGRRLIESRMFVKEGGWKTWHPMHFLGPNVYGATLGIVGMGRIGLEMARRARGFDMKVLYTDPNRRSREDEREFNLKYQNLDELLSKSDFISLHVNLTPKTHHLISKREFHLMKTTAVLVNAARGPIVDHDALYDSLKKREIFAAGLDVTDPEPLPKDHPLLSLDNCIVVPHIASASFSSRLDMSLLAAQNLLAGLDGKPLPNCANPEVYGIR